MKKQERYMNLEQFLEHLNSGKPVKGGSEAHLFML